jgi:hypothetical protein
MWKTILALAALVLSVGASAHLIGTANATFGPSVSTGFNPIQNYGGIVSSDGIITTAPADQDLIVTGILTNNACAVQVGGTEMVPQTSYFHPTRIYNRAGYDWAASVFTIGAATLRVPAGQTLVLACTGSRYYVQGYLVQP